MKEEITPIKAIMVYQCEVESENFDYMEMIEYNQGIPTKSYPLPEEFLEELSRNYMKKTERTFNFSLMRENPDGLRIIGFDYRDESTKMYFYTPATAKNLFFRKNTNIKSGKYPIPALIWKATLNSVSLWAVAEKYKDLSKDTMLYKAPFMNTSSSGVCLGSTQMPKTVSNDLEYICQKIVDGFFESQFTHFGSDYKVTNSNFYTLFESLKGKNHYPDHELVEFKPLNEVLHELF